MSAGAFGFQDDHVRRRRLVIGFDGGGDAAHVNRQMRLAEAAVFAAARTVAAVASRLAKGLHRHARRRRDIVVAVRRRGVRVFFGSLWVRLIICLYR